MAAPRADLARIRRWCASALPEDRREHARLEPEFGRLDVTIRLVDAAGSAPVARLRYTETTGLWSLHWFTESGGYHEHRGLGRTPHVRKILDYLASGADPIFRL